jgi:hypothetical protein
VDRVGSVKSLSQRLEDRGEFVKRRNKERTMMGFAGLRLKQKLSPFIKPDANCEPKPKRSVHF